MITNVSRRSARGALRRYISVHDDARRIYMFPGQGSQFVGMAQKLISENGRAKALFDDASEILGYDLSEICSKGPPEFLNSTDVSQPAIFVTSMAAQECSLPTAHRVLGVHSFAMGLSLGEYSALCFAQSFSFEDGVRLTKIRGEAMQAASSLSPSGMVAVLGLERNGVSDLINSVNAEIGEEQIFIGNFLSPVNFTLSGTVEGCKLVKRRGKSHGAKLVRQLPVSGAFHTRFMAPARAALKVALSKIDVKPPAIPVLSNVTGVPHSKCPDSIRENLLKQLTEPVLWYDNLKYVFPTELPQLEVFAFEVGPGSVCTDLMKKYSEGLCPKPFSINIIKSEL